jgi:hypothetical protein
MEISRTDRAGNEEELQGVKEERNNLHRTKRRKANWIGHILRRNCFLKHVIGGKDVSDRKTRRKMYAATGCS